MLPAIPNEGFTYWANEERVFITAYQKATNPTAWNLYKEGLSQHCIRSNTTALFNEQHLDKQPVPAFWLIHDATHSKILGGWRWTHPIFTEPDLHLLPAFSDLCTTSPYPHLRSQFISYASNGGILEQNGAWFAKGMSKLSKLPFLNAWHAMHCLQVNTVVATICTTRLTNAKSCGYFLLDDTKPASAGSTINNDTVPVFCTKDSFANVDHNLRKRILREQAYLTPFGCRVRPNGHQIMFDLPHRKELIASGVGERPVLKQLLQEADECGYRDDTASLPTQAHPWIYYPWRNTMIQVLAPDLFWKVRQDRNRNKLTLDEMDMLRGKTIGVVGLSVGASIAHCLAQQGMCGELRIADFDSLELSNLNRLSGSVLDIGVPKVEMAARKLAEINPFLTVRTFEEGINQDNVDPFLQGLDIVVEECDSFDVKLLIRQRARKFGIPVVMETSDNGLIDVERFDLEDAKPFHGLVPDMPFSDLANWGMAEKIPFGLQLLDVGELSPRFAASLIEIDATLSSWPQLAEDISLGTALTVAACRRILLGQHQPSGRARTGLDQVLESMQRPQKPQLPPVQPALVQRHPLPTEQYSAIEMASQLAPSGGNMQPWCFQIDKQGFSVYARNDLHTVGLDIGRRGTAVSCGAALANAWCMASHLRLLAGSQELPNMFNDPQNPEFCGHLQFGSDSDDLADLGPFIQHRCSNRRTGPAEPLSTDVVNRLERVASRARARLIYVPIDKLDVIIKSWAESDRVRMLNKRLHDELFSELRLPYEGNLQEGIDVRTLELSKLDEAAIQVLRRWDVAKWLSEWDVGSKLSEMGTRGLRGSAGIVVVAVKGRTWADYVRGGFAMELVWLEATRLNVGMQVMTPIFSYSHSEEDLMNLVGEKYATRLQRAKEEAFSHIGLEPDEAFVLALRAHRGQAPSALSERRPLAHPTSGP